MNVNALPKILLFLPLVALLTGCMSRTIIRSNPTGADVYIDGEYYGQTPIEYGDRKISLSSSTVRLAKQGYREGSFVITKDGNLKAGPVLCGCATLPFMLPVGWLWAMGYQKLYKFELYPEP